MKGQSRKTRGAAFRRPESAAVAEAFRKARYGRPATQEEQRETAGFQAAIDAEWLDGDPNHVPRIRGRR